MRTQEQFDSDSDRMKRVRMAVRDSFFCMVIWILSFIALAGITWIYFNGDKVDSHINHLLKL